MAIGISSDRDLDVLGRWTVPAGGGDGANLSMSTERSRCGRALAITSKVDRADTR
jgi:hypothetical protein